MSEGERVPNFASINVVISKDGNALWEVRASDGMLLASGTLLNDPDGQQALELAKAVVEQSDLESAGWTRLPLSTR